MPRTPPRCERKRRDAGLRAAATIGLGILVILLVFALPGRRQEAPSIPPMSPPQSPEVSPGLPPATMVTPAPHPTATPSPLPTPTLTPTVPLLPEPHVVIIGRDPVAEYVDIQNLGQTVVSLDGWRLVSERGGQGCWLGGPLHPGERLRIWANGGYEVGLHCRYLRSIWSNTEPDAAVLYDATGQVVSRFE